MGRDAPERYLTGRKEKMLERGRMLGTWMDGYIYFAMSMVLYGGGTLKEG